MPHAAPSSELASRLARAQSELDHHGLDALVVSPGPDLRYLCGYDAIALERLTALVVTARAVHLVVPGLEVPAAQASRVSALEVELHAWGETDDPYRLVASLLPPDARVGVEARMWAAKAFALSAAGLRTGSGDGLLSGLRLVKSEYELAALRGAGAAIDAVHAQVPTLLRAGRTEAEVGADIAAAITASGHASVDFVIVASGPNGASPHHAVSGRRLVPGDLVVVDIGGTMPDGYCSDSTRTYAVGQPHAAALAAYAALEAAQELGVGSVAPGRTTESVDAVTRSALTAAGYGELFIHRTGHGIGLETHEAPYLVAGDATVLAPGMCFSVEPGVYSAGDFGARIEDIVACTASGWERLNSSPRHLVVVE